MRHIVQITPYYPPHLGGLERVAQSLSTRLAQRHDVRVITSAVSGSEAARREQAEGVRIRRHRAVEAAHTPLAPGAFVSLLATPRDAVLHLHCAHALWPETVMLCARLRRQRYIVHFHLDVDGSGSLGWLLPAYKKHVFGRVLRGAGAVIALTESQARFLREEYGIAKERIFVVPNGIEERYFADATAPARDEDQAGPLRLLFVGRLDVQKNVARLLDAMSLVREPVRLRLVGDGELRTELEAQAVRLGLDVEFSGRLLGPELVAAYRAADAFVLPSDKEGMPLAALEAMAAGLPVVATDVPGNSDLLQGVGILAEPEPAALATAIDSLAADPELRFKVAERCAEAARQYSWDAVVSRIEAVYSEVYA
ncbi:glycosyltransferase family 4 protein [Actinocrinis sp.]|uniref:glycosyltransferase family 4 protein n=1 Tax=Actinocrinis sp. TaxID=1920516 RepID=UPI002D4FD2A2|nr:glycosyltransferase family 4 protein [Actinocrinis sp.]HZP53367.1 glycosyltransferase family 4 protein [Actinocrinis sp.]